MPPITPIPVHWTADSDGLYDMHQLREIEQRIQATLPPHALMQRAGLAAADTAQAIVRDAIASGAAVASDGAPIETLSVLIVAGPGNNGGDAFECGFHLAQRGWQVTLWRPLAATAPGADFLQALERVRTCAVTIVEGADAADCAMFSRLHWSLVIDGLFGIGLTHALGGALPGVIATMNAIDAPLLALDVPSGLNADTGTVPTEDGAVKVCVRATHTLTFIADKPGLHTCDGRDQAGVVAVAALDIPATLLPTARALLNHPPLFTAAVHARRHASHKGSFGDVQIVGGAAGMVGAALLAAHAALKAGSGRVLIGFADASHAPAYDTMHPELMCRSAAELDFNGATLVVGPGLGTTALASALVLRACASDGALVLDADALNLLASTPKLAEQVVARSACERATLLTPHPLEAARLLGITAQQVQADRLGAARALARRFHATVILKGSGTVIADGDFLAINPTGNPALATGGTGDVLSGVCAALLAQRWPARDAALGAVWIHGEAADLLVAKGVGPAGVTASEIIDAARVVLNALISTFARN